MVSGKRTIVLQSTLSRKYKRYRDATISLIVVKEHTDMRRPIVRLWYQRRRPTVCKRHIQNLCQVRSNHGTKRFNLKDGPPPLVDQAA